MKKHVALFKWSEVYGRWIHIRDEHLTEKMKELLEKTTNNQTAPRATGAERKTR